LTISGVYVDLVEHSRGNAFDVHTFTTEPQCWHPTGSGSYLRPDAYVILRTGAVGHCWWLKIDNGTGTTPRLRAKIRTYREHFTSGVIGPDGVSPRILITAHDQTRAHTIAQLVDDTDESIAVTPHDYSKETSRAAR
jgi:hypothetical protein